jgi:hypothetical protein
MKVSIDKSIEILSGTPKVLRVMLLNISDNWTSNNEGGDSWSAYDVVGHLLHCEKADWVLRAEIILSDNPNVKWEPFDRYAHFEESKGKKLKQLLVDFENYRMRNIDRLKSKKLGNSDLQKIGLHPNFGEVTLSQLLSTWVVHDLGHISQISRVMAKQYIDEVGPWKEYLGILKQ